MSGISPHDDLRRCNDSFSFYISFVRAKRRFWGGTSLDSTFTDFYRDTPLSNRRSKITW